MQINFGDTPWSLGQARHFFKQMGLRCHTTRQQGPTSTATQGSRAHSSTSAEHIPTSAAFLCTYLRVPYNPMLPDAYEYGSTRQQIPTSAAFSRVLPTYECCPLSSTLQPVGICCLLSSAAYLRVLPSLEYPTTRRYLLPSLECCLPTSAALSRVPYNP